MSMNWKLTGIIAAVAVTAFVLGAMIFGGSAPTTHSDDSGRNRAPAAEVWTCSMHPQIKLPKPGKCPICFMDLIPLRTGPQSDLQPRQLKLSETAKQLAQIQTAPVVRGSATSNLRLLGKLAYDETRLAKITARVAGRIDELKVDFTGQSVRRGEAVASIYSPDLLSAQQELLQARATAEKLEHSESKVLRETAAANLKSAREKLRLWGFGDEQIEAVERSGRASDHLTITSPQAGIVVEKMVQEGQYVETGMPLYNVADLSRLWVQIEAYESDLAHLRVGDKLVFTTAGYPGEKFDATISFVSPVVDPMTRTALVRAAIDNTRALLKPEMYVTAELEASTTAADQLLIPATAPLLTGRRAVVYVEMPSTEGVIYEGREVELGAKSGSYYVVRSGLSEGEMVVTNGAFKLDSELQIQAQPSMMAPEGQASPAAHDHGAAARSTPTKTVSISHEVQAALTPVYATYFEVQMALANDNLEESKAAAKKLDQANQAVEMGLFRDDAHAAWMKLTTTVAKEAARLAAAESFETARDAFFFLSDAMIELHKQFGHAEARNYYLTFCPMARDGKGAYWLQTVDTVWNSFYGDQMLRCGEIKDTLEPGSGD